MRVFSYLVLKEGYSLPVVDVYLLALSRKLTGKEAQGS